MNKTTILATLLLISIIGAYRVKSFVTEERIREIICGKKTESNMHRITREEYQYFPQRSQRKRVIRKETRTCSCQVHVYGMPSGKEGIMAP